MLLHFQNKTDAYLVDDSFGVQYMSVTNTKDLKRQKYHIWTLAKEFIQVNLA